MTAPKRLHDAVAKAGGDISAEQSVKPWELPKWVLARARELGLVLEPEAARALIAHTGDRQQRLLRELEKLALEGGEGAEFDAQAIDELTAPSAELKAWQLADALLSGETEAATRVYLALRAQGERVPGLLYWMAQRLRQGLEVAVALEAGEPPAQVRRRLRMPSKAAEQLLGDARRAVPSGCAKRSRSSPTSSWPRAGAERAASARTRRRCWRSRGSLPDEQTAVDICLDHV